MKWQDWVLFAAFLLTASVATAQVAIESPIRKGWELVYAGSGTFDQKATGRFTFPGKFTVQSTDLLLDANSEGYTVGSFRTYDGAILLPGQNDAPSHPEPLVKFLTLDPDFRETAGQRPLPYYATWAQLFNVLLPFHALRRSVKLGDSWTQEDTSVLQVYSGHLKSKFTYKVTGQEVEKTLVAFGKTHPQSLYQPVVEKMELMLQGYKKSVQRKTESLSLIEKLVSQPQSELTLLDPDGKQHSLSEFKGKVIVLGFLFTQTPSANTDPQARNLQEIWEPYRAKGVQVVGIGVLGPLPTENALMNARSFAEQNKITYPLWVDTTKELQREGRDTSPIKQMSS